MRNEALQKALDSMGHVRGNAAALAKVLGISTQAISQWREVPVNRVLDIESVTGVPRYELRPDIYPPPRRHEPKGRGQIGRSTAQSALSCLEKIPADSTSQRHSGGCL